MVRKDNGSWCSHGDNGCLLVGLAIGVHDEFGLFSQTIDPQLHDPLDQAVFLIRIGFKDFLKGGSIDDDNVDIVSGASIEKPGKISK